MRPIPPLVERAEALARELRFDRSSSRETGALLHVLAASRGRERVAETGTGVGVGAAWIVSALAPHVPFFTAELDEDRARAAADLFRRDEHVTVLHGDWHDVLAAEAPFDLLFHDGSKRRPDVDGEHVVGMLTPGGIVVMDDMTPGHTGADPVREYWFGHPWFAAVEAQVSAGEAVIVAVRAR